jgi:hypothetical protein
MQDGFLAKKDVCFSSFSTDKLQAASDFINGIVNLKDWVQYNKDNYRRSIVESVITTFQKELLDLNIADLFQK